MLLFWHLNKIISLKTCLLSRTYFGPDIFNSYYIVAWLNFIGLQQVGDISSTGFYAKYNHLNFIFIGLQLFWLTTGGSAKLIILWILLHAK